MFSGQIFILSSNRAAALQLFIIFYLKEKGKYILEAGGASGRTPRKRAPLVRSKGFPRAAK
jgi:hypothetical protein